MPFSVSYYLGATELYLLKRGKNRQCFVRDEIGCIHCECLMTLESKLPDRVDRDQKMSPQDQRGVVVSAEHLVAPLETKGGATATSAPVD